MQITDMLNQYNRNIANGVEISGGTQGIKQLVSSLQEMSVGNVFEGSINHMENGIVTLGLSDGKTIQAKLDSGVSVQVGESMFFQVKSNNGTQIAIRPFSNGGIANPTLLNALEAANLQTNGKMLTMVNTMMEQSMPIDKQSLLNMARLVMGNEGMDITSIVQMVKLGIPVTEEMAAQFENYKSDQYAVLDQLESVMEQLPGRLAGGSLTSEQLLELNQQMTEVILGGELSAEGESVQGAENVMESAEEGQILQNAVLSEEAVNKTSEVPQPETIVQKGKESLNVLLEEQQAAARENKAVEVKDAVLQETVSKSPTGQNTAGTALEHLFSGKALQHLSDQLGKIPELSQNPSVFADGKLNGDLTSKELLQLLSQTFSSRNAFSKQGLSEFVSSKNYRTLVKNVMEEQWLLRPEDLKTEHKVNELYERLDRQMDQMEKVLKAFGQSTPQLSETTSGVRSNIQFMNQINQTYAYVQIPLKLAGQNVHSDLYVYTDRKKMREKDGELTAFLHLDMEHLGSTDVSVRMHQKKVTTNFYLADDAAYQLIMDHMDILEERLEKKGYSVKIKVTNQEEKVDFVEDFLKKDQPSAGGMVHRYSFDVRA